MPPVKALFVLSMAFLLLLFNGGSRFTIGLTLKPMANDLVWSRTTLSLMVTVFMVVSAVVLPVIGRLVDRYNPKVILVLALLVSSTSIALMGLIQTPFQAILLYGVIFALSNAGTSVAPYRRSDQSLVSRSTRPCEQYRDIGYGCGSVGDYFVVNGAA